MLKFVTGNAKLSKDTAIFNIPAGWTCPFAKDCKAKVNPDTGKLIKFENTKFRCYACTSELISPQARKMRWGNYNALTSKDSIKDMSTLIENAIAELNLTKIKKVRIHESGDFFNQMYFDAWLQVAKIFPNIIFYAYTKSLNYWLNRIDSVPSNVFLTASKGGKLDYLIEEHKLKYIEVVLSRKEAKDKNLELDHDDSLMYTQNKPFAILIHGTQPAGSEAMKAIMTLRKSGITGYKRGTKGKGRKQ